MTTTDARERPRAGAPLWLRASAFAAAAAGIATACASFSSSTDTTPSPDASTQPETGAPPPVPPSSGDDGGALGAIAFVDLASTTIANSDATQAIQVQAPTAEPGDVLVATLALGRTDNMSSASLAPPPGWTLLERKDEGAVSFLATYWHTATATELPAWTWTSTLPLEGLATIAVYRGADPDKPIAASATGETSDVAHCDTPSILVPQNGLVVIALAAHGDAMMLDGGETTAPSVPAGLAERFKADNGSTRALTIGDGPGPSTMFVVDTGVPQSYCLTETISLRPNHVP